MNTILPENFPSMTKKSSRVTLGATPSISSVADPGENTALPDDAPLQIRSHRRAQWFWIDNAVIDRYGEQIHAAGIGLYTALARYANHRTGTCFPSLARLSRQLGCTPKTAAKYLQRLVQVGLIRVEERPGHTYVITLLDLASSSAVEEDSHPGRNDQGSADPGTLDQPPTSKIPDSLEKKTTEPEIPNQRKEPKKAEPDDRSAYRERKPKPDAKDETSPWDKLAVVPEWEGKPRIGDVLAAMALSEAEHAALDTDVQAIIEGQPLDYFTKHNVIHRIGVKETLVLALRSGCSPEEACAVAARFGLAVVPCIARAA